MAKKILFAALVLFSLLFCPIAKKCFADVAAQFEQAETYKKQGYNLQAEEIYQTIAADYPGTSYALKAQRGLVIVYILTQRNFDAQDALDKLTADFAGYSEPNAVAEALFDIARQYEWSAKYEEAKSVFEQITQQHPNSWYVNRTDLAVPRMNIMGLIASGRDDEVQTAINELLSNPDFAGHPDFPATLHGIAKRYNWSHKYEEAKEMYLQLVQRYPDSSYAGEVPLSVPATNILSLIESGNETEAQTAIDKLVTDFAGQPALPATLYGIAEKYEWTYQFEKARELYQQIVQQYPDSPQAHKAQLYVLKTNILSLIKTGNDGEAQAAIDKLITDFNDLPSGLAKAIFQIGGEYYIKALGDTSEGLDTKAETHFRKAIAVWERTIEELPPSATTPEAYRLAAVCYHRLGEYEKAIEYCQKIIDNWPDYQYAWHAEFLIDRYSEQLANSRCTTTGNAK